MKRAFEIYADFETAYVPGVNEYAGIADNTAEYEAGYESGYVVGSWKYTDHNSSIQQF